MNRSHTLIALASFSLFVWIGLAETDDGASSVSEEEIRRCAECEIRLRRALQNLRHIAPEQRDKKLEAELAGTMDELRAIRNGAGGSRTQREQTLVQGRKLASRCAYLIDTGHRLAGRSEKAWRETIPGGPKSKFVGRWDSDHGFAPLELRADGTFVYKGEGIWREFKDGFRVYLEYRTKKFMYVVYLGRDGKLFIRDHDVELYFSKSDATRETKDTRPNISVEANDAGAP